jgi:hypothetical protein
MCVQLLLLLLLEGPFQEPIYIIAWHLVKVGGRDTSVLNDEQVSLLLLLLLQFSGLKNGQGFLRNY